LVASLNTEIEIRPFADDDAPQVRELSITTNWLLSPPDLCDAFEGYMERALAEEIDRITDYYREHAGGFWVTIQNDGLVGTFGLERAAPDAMELRRMYVDAAARRNGIGRRMLQCAEDECRRRNIARLELSTAEIQTAAIALYTNAGYQLVREDIAEIEEQQNCRRRPSPTLFPKNSLKRDAVSALSSARREKAEHGAA
jgi:GNAT superfamily N-acetyltransferase